MGRAKLRMELITKEKTRNTTYHKRKHGIMKKANEFTIFCNVDTVIIIYPPNSDTPEIWSENPKKIKKTIDCYKAKKGLDTGKRTYNLKYFYKDRKKKIEDELVKARKKSMEAKYWCWWVFQHPVVHGGGVVPEFVRDEDDLQVNNNNYNNNIGVVSL